MSRLSLSIQCVPASAQRIGRTVSWTASAIRQAGLERSGDQISHGIAVPEKIAVIEIVLSAGWYCFISQWRFVTVQGNENPDPDNRSLTNASIIPLTRAMSGTCSLSHWRSAKSKSVALRHLPPKNYTLGFQPFRSGGPNFIKTDSGAIGFCHGPSHVLIAAMPAYYHSYICYNDRTLSHPHNNRTIGIIMFSACIRRSVVAIQWLTPLVIRSR